jgi:hypothetical protein
MIDTDKYEGELEYRMNKEFCNDIACGDMNKDLAIQYAHEFYGNALDLIEEVKRLRKQVSKAKEWVRSYFINMSGDFNSLEDKVVYDDFMQQMGMKKND